MNQSVARLLLVVGLVCFVATPDRIDAHGLHGHVHVTGWAIENLPPGELRTIFDDPDVFQAALAGAMFPDTGYAPGRDDRAAREYGEYAHWEPFIERFIQYVRAEHGPPYDTKEKKMLVAFLLGCAAHGLQDELFDSTFLYEVEQRDGAGQDIADPGTDGFLVLDGYFRLLPSDYLPIDEVLPLFGSDVLGVDVDAQLIADQVRTVRSAYVNDTLGTRVAAGFGQRARTQIPWASENYLDPSVHGSLGAEIVPTARHMQALWERLHDRFDEADLVVHAWPADPRRLRSASHQDVASWITLVFGKGVEQGRATASLIDGAGMPHPFNLRYTRWGGTSRLIRFQPTTDLVPGAHYSAVLEAGAELVDGSHTTIAHEHAFQVDCIDADDPQCPPVEITGDPTIIVLEPTATWTATVTPTSTATTTSTVTPTSTAVPTATPTFTLTQTATAVATSTPTSTATLTGTVVPSANPTATLEPTPEPVATASPTLTATRVPPQTSNNEGSCRVNTETQATLPALGGLLLALLAWSSRRRRDS